MYATIRKSTAEKHNMIKSEKTLFINGWHYEYKEHKGWLTFGVSRVNALEGELESLGITEYLLTEEGVA